MYVCNNFTVYVITRKILEQSALSFFSGTLGNLGQNEFAFEFCGFTTSLVVGDPCSLSTLVYRSVCVPVMRSGNEATRCIHMESLVVLSMSTQSTSDVSRLLFWHTMLSVVCLSHNNLTPA